MQEYKIEISQQDINSARILYKNRSILQAEAAYKEKGMQIRGRVKGNFGFVCHVSVDVDNTGEEPVLLRGSCNCFEAKNGKRICCHMIALAMSRCGEDITPVESAMLSKAEENDQTTPALKELIEKCQEIMSVHEDENIMIEPRITFAPGASFGTCSLECKTSTGIYQVADTLDFLIAKWHRRPFAFEKGRNYYVKDANIDPKGQNLLSILETIVLKEYPFLKENPDAYYEAMKEIQISSVEFSAILNLFEGEIIRLNDQECLIMNDNPPTPIIVEPEGDKGFSIHVKTVVRYLDTPELWLYMDQVMYRCSSDYTQYMLPFLAALSALNSQWNMSNSFLSADDVNSFLETVLPQLQRTGNIDTSALKAMANRIPLAENPVQETEAEIEEPETEEPANEEAEQEEDSFEEITAEKEEENPAEDVPFEARTMNILFGTNLETEEPVVWHPNDTTEVFHVNTGIIGTMGTGKTQFTKSLIAQLCRERENNYDGARMGLLIFDYKGDYNESKQDFMKEVKPKVLKPYKMPFNPFALYQAGSFKPLLPVHTANTFKETVAKIYKLGPIQQNTLTKCIEQAYKKCGILPDRPETWTKPAPTFEMVYQIYQNESAAKADSLSAVMEKLHGFCIFESDQKKTIPLFDMLRGVVTVDLSGYESDIQSLVIAFMLELFYSQMHHDGSSKTDGKYRQLTKLVLVDEADSFMAEEFPVLKKILKEGREFGVGVILSTQFLGNFSSKEEDYARYVVNWIVHNVDDLKPTDVEYVFKTKQKSAETQRIYNQIKTLEKHQSLVRVGNQEPVCIRDKAFYELLQDK